MRKISAIFSSLPAGSAKPETNHTMTATIENTAHLTRDQITSVGIIADTIRTQAVSLKDAANWLRELGGFVYEGGSHVAYHLNDSDTRRVIIVTQ